MNIQELGNKASSNWNKRIEIMQLVLPPKKSDNKYRYMAGRYSPKGEIVGTAKDGTVVNFGTLDVLAWCVVHGAEGVIVPPDGIAVSFSSLLKEANCE